MRQSTALLIAAFAVLVTAGAALAQQTPAKPQTQDEKRQEIQHMAWADHGDLKLAASQSTLALPPSFRAVGGADARRLSEILNAQDDATVEGVITAPDGSVIYLRYVNSGYVTLDDWSDLDPDDLLKSVTKNTEANNAKLTAQGMPALFVDGWLQKPALDRENTRVNWAFAAHDANGEKLVNVIALQLGRKGFEKLIWAGTAALYSTSNSLTTILQAHTFDGGVRYADHLDSDKAAGYGIAALIGAVAGAKALKVAAGAGLFILLKKFALVPILAAIAFFRKRIGGAFRRKPSGFGGGDAPPPSA